MTGATVPLRTFALTAILLVLPAGMASAQDATAVAERLSALMTKQGMEMRWDKAAGDPSRIVLEGVTLKPAGAVPANPIGDVVLSNVTENNGAFRVGSLSTTAFSVNIPGAKMDVGPVVLNGLSLPARDAADPMASLMLYEDAALESLSVEKDGRNVFAMRDGYSRMSATDGRSPMEFSGGVREFSTDLSMVDNRMAKQYLEALGHTRLQGNTQSSGSWHPADGRLSLTKYDIAIDDVGTLGLTLDIGGLTPELVDRVNTLATQMDGNAGQGQFGDQMALLGTFASATFNQGSLRFSDDSLTSRAINMVADSQGVAPADVANLARGAVPLALMHMQMGDLVGLVAPAINTFLDNPDNIQILARPSAPVTFAEIGSAVVATPHDQAATARALVDLLGISVSANQ